jgi:hypothetical protein
MLAANQILPACRMKAATVPGNGSGLVAATLPSSSMSGLRATRATPETAQATTAQATARQAGDSSRPVGYTRARNMSAATAGASLQVPANAAMATPARPGWAAP